MDELLPIEEIELRDAPDWVLIGEPQTGEDLSVRAGRVLFHSPGPRRGLSQGRRADETRGRFAVRLSRDLVSRTWRFR